MALDPAASFYQLFRENLVDLVNADRGSIQTFYEVARDNIGSLAMTKAIAQAILDHIKECPPGQKLPALYVLDMISKNPDTKPQFKPLFESSNLAQVVSKAWKDVWSLPDIKPRFLRVIHTWRSMNTFNSQLLDAVDAELQKLASAPTVPASGGWNSVLHGAVSNAGVPTDPRVRASNVVSNGASLGTSFVPTAPTPDAALSLLAAQMASARPALPVANVPNVTLPSSVISAAVTPAVPQAVVPSSSVVVPATISVLPNGEIATKPVAVLSSVNSILGIESRPSSSLPAVLHAVSQAAVASAVAASSQLPIPVSQPLMLSSVASTVTGATSQSSLARLAAASQALSVGAGVNVPASVQIDSAARTASDPTEVPELTAGAVESIGVTHAADCAVATASPVRENLSVQPAVALHDSQPNSTTGNKPDSSLRALSDLLKLMEATKPVEESFPLGTAEFPPAAKLKVHSDAVVEELLEHSRQTRPKLLDLQFRKNSRKRSQINASRQWFVTTDNWLAGTTTATEGPAAFFDDQKEQIEAVEDVTVHRQPRDDSKRACAISGEAFDMVYDDDTEKWWFENCVKLESEEAAAYGVPDGSYVKTTALTSTPSSSLAALAVQRDNTGSASVSQQTTNADEVRAVSPAVSSAAGVHRSSPGHVGSKRIGEDFRLDSVRNVGTELQNVAAAKRIRV